MQSDVFLSYARKDDGRGHITALRNALAADFQRYSDPVSIFFDQTEIEGFEDWHAKLAGRVRTAVSLVACVSPRYFESDACDWEWREFHASAARRRGSGEASGGAYLEAVGELEGRQGSWLEELWSRQRVDFRDWFAELGATSGGGPPTRPDVGELSAALYRIIRRHRTALTAPGNLRGRTPRFVGRSSELASVRSALAGGAHVGVITALHGLGGIGKSQLAIAYARADAARYQAGTWIVQASGRMRLMEAVADLASIPALGLEVTADELANREHLGERVLHRLFELHAAAPDGENSALLILDNVDRSELVSEYNLSLLDGRPWLQVLATTRLAAAEVGADGVDASVHAVVLDGLDAEASLELLRAYQPERPIGSGRREFASGADEAAAVVLVELLDGHALAVEQAAAYLASRPDAPVADLVDVLKSDLTALDREVGAASGRGEQIRRRISHADKLVAAVVAESFRALGATEKRVLAYASLMPPDSVPIAWLRDLTGVAEQDFDDALRLLDGRRLLTEADSEFDLRIHRLVAAHIEATEVTSAHANDFEQLVQRETAALFVGATTMANLDAIASGLIWSLPRSWLMLDIADNFATRFGANLRAERYVELTGAMVAVHRERHEAGDARDEGGRRFAIAFERHGFALRAFGDLAGAKAQFDSGRRVLERLRDMSATDEAVDSALAVAYQSLGNVASDQEDYEEAWAQFEKSCSIRLELCKRDEASLVRGRDLAVAYEDLGGVAMLAKDRSAWCPPEPPTAREYFDAAVGITRQLIAAKPSAEHYRSLSVSLDRLGNLLASEKAFPEAAEAFSEALAIDQHEAARVPEDLALQERLAIGHNNLGRVVLRIGDVIEATRLFLTGAQISESLLERDPDRLDFKRAGAVSLVRMAEAHSAMGNFALGKERAEKARVVLSELVPVYAEFEGLKRELGVAGELLEHFDRHEELARQKESEAASRVGALRAEANRARNQATEAALVAALAEWSVLLSSLQRYSEAVEAAEAALAIATRPTLDVPDCAADLADLLTVVEFAARAAGETSLADHARSLLLEKVGEPPLFDQLDPVRQRRRPLDA